MLERILDLFRRAWPLLQFILVPPLLHFLSFPLLIINYCFRHHFRFFWSRFFCRSICALYCRRASSFCGCPSHNRFPVSPNTSIECRFRRRFRSFDVVLCVVDSACCSAALVSFGLFECNGNDWHQHYLRMHDGKSWKCCCSLAFRCRHGGASWNKGRKQCVAILFCLPAVELFRCRLLAREPRVKVWSSFYKNGCSEWSWQWGGVILFFRFVLFPTIFWYLRVVDERCIRDECFVLFFVWIGTSINNLLPIETFYRPPLYPRTFPNRSKTGIVCHFSFLSQYSYISLARRFKRLGSINALWKHIQLQRLNLHCKDTRFCWTRPFKVAFFILYAHVFYSTFLDHPGEQFHWTSACRPVSGVCYVIHISNFFQITLTGLESFEITPMKMSKSARIDPFDKDRQYLSNSDESRPLVE